MMRLLMDTQVMIWALSEPRKLGKRAQAVLSDPENELWLSHAAAFELAVKISIGKFEFFDRFAVFEQFMEGAEQALGFAWLPFSMAHAATLSRLPALHRDPFDRLMIAQAVTDGLTLVSSDEAFARYAGLSLIRV